MREDIIRCVKDEKIIAIVRGIDKESCSKVAQALYDGGIRLMEITYNQSDPSSWNKTALAIQEVAEQFQGRMFVGAGTVTSTELVELTHNHGGKFIISPDVNKEVIQRTVSLGMVSMPGALTPTEVMQAHSYGADFVKVFPAGSMGANYLKAICSPINHIDILAVGGINENNIADFLKAGALGVGVGGNLVNRNWIEQGEFEKITEYAKHLVSKS